MVVTQTDSDRALPAEDSPLVGADKLAGVYQSVSEALAAFEAANEPFVAAGTITSSRRSSRPAALTHPPQQLR